MKEPLSEIGKAVRYHRLCKNLTQKQLAKKVYVNVSVVKTLESKVLDYNFMQRVRLLSYLGINLNWLGKESLAQLKEK